MAVLNCSFYAIDNKMPVDQYPLFEQTINKLERYGWKVEERTQNTASLFGILLTPIIGIILLTAPLGILGSLINIIVFSEFLKLRKINVALTENGNVAIEGDSINISIASRRDLAIKFETNRIRAIQSKKVLNGYSLYLGVGVTLVYLFIIIAPAI